MTNDLNQSPTLQKEKISPVTALLDSGSLTTIHPSLLNLSCGHIGICNLVFMPVHPLSPRFFFRTFLWELNGDPRIKNADGQTSLHCACQASGQPKSLSTQERRTACVLIILQWLHGSREGTSSPEDVDVIEKAVDFDISAPDKVCNAWYPHRLSSSFFQKTPIITPKKRSF